jgi:MFS family permease
MATASGTAPAQSNTFFYGWVILAASCFGMFAISIVRSSIGVWVIPMEQTFGTDRATISTVGTIFSFVFGVAQPFIGRIADRFGPRWAIAGGTWAVGLGLIALLWANSVWQVWVFYSGIAALGFAASGFVTQSALLSRWFMRYRGSAIAAMTAGFSLGFVLLIQIVTQATLTIGWQNTAAIMGAFFVVVAAPLALLVLRNSPEDIGQRQDGAAVVAGTPPMKPTFTSLRQAAGTAGFWLLLISYVSCGFNITMIQFHLIPLTRGLNPTYTAEQASWAIAIVALANTVAAIPAGWLADRFGKKYVLAGSYAIRVGALLYLATVTDLTGVYIFAVLFGITWLNTIPPTSGLTADLFGRFSVGLLFGFIAMGHEFGGAIATQLAGVIFDQTQGDYGPALVVGAILSLIATVASLAIREPSLARRKG